VGSGPELTVVVLTYNSAKDLRHCLDALARQVDPDFDLLVVDDDSTDDTLQIVASYAEALRIRVARNGTHRICHGRNIGLRGASSRWVAFVDSDDLPLDDWTAQTKRALREHPEAALLSGARVAGWRTPAARAIALNDETVRDLTWNGVLDFAAGNCAINLETWPDAAFDEEFTFAEDLEMAARARGRRVWIVVPTMVVQHFSRDSLGGYALQMYRYGRMKQLFSLSFRLHRPIDHAPTLVTALGLVSALATRHWWLVLAVVPFSALEAAFVVIYRRCRPHLFLLSWAAWMTKNVAWSAGMVRGLVDVGVHPPSRNLVRQKRLQTAKAS
jgi:glycosyltransferase involved in cell wall biosynthesis